MWLSLLASQTMLLYASVSFWHTRPTAIICIGIRAHSPPQNFPSEPCVQVLYRTSGGLLEITNLISGLPCQVCRRTSGLQSLLHYCHSSRGGRDCFCSIHTAAICLSPERLLYTRPLNRTPSIPIFQPGFGKWTVRTCTAPSPITHKPHLLSPPETPVGNQHGISIC